MIDYDFLAKHGINPKDVPQIQSEILRSMEKNEFSELNKKYKKDVLEHLCNDLVDQGKLGRIGKFTSSGIQFPYFLIK
ncbi:MAG TPA: hypothetical protein VNK44_05785 [Candidatus Nitrosotenuis sp.]|nr:hypothetical protein [Candidatus Nitrosotenuis sp.]